MLTHKWTKETHGPTHTHNSDGHAPHVWATPRAAILAVALPRGDVRIVLGDFLRQTLRVRRVGLDVRLQDLDVLLGLRDGALLVHGGVVAELLEGGELNLRIGACPSLALNPDVGKLV